MVDSSSERRLVHKQFDPTDDDPLFDVVSTVAELEDTDVEALPSFHDSVDGILEHIFTNPPAPEAQVSIEFTYAGYRITLHQDGAATFRKVGDPP